MKRAFVTGSTGLLGSNLVRELLEQGWDVRALARSRARAEEQLAGLGVDIVLGDLLDVDGFAEALSDIDVVFHCAAYFRDSYKGGSHWTLLEKVNVAGTRALVEAAHRAGVQRFVHVSSTATVLPLDGRPGREDDRRSAADAHDDYYRSKVLADEAVEAYLELNPDFWATFVLPGFMQGPGDLGPTSAGQMLIDFATGKLPGVIDLNLSMVDARDVAFALVRAAERGQRGRRYLAAGRTHHLRDVYAVMATVTGVAAPRLSIPSALLWAYAAASEIYARATGRPVLLSWAGVSSTRAESGRSVFDSSRAIEELGASFRPLTESLTDSLAWYRARGTL